MPLTEPIAGAGGKTDITPWMGLGVARAHCKTVCGLGEIVVVSGNTIYHTIDIVLNHIEERGIDYRRGLIGVSQRAPGQQMQQKEGQDWENHPKLRLDLPGPPAGAMLSLTHLLSLCFSVFTESMRLFQDSTLSTSTSATPSLCESQLQTPRYKSGLAWGSFPPPPGVENGTQRR